MIGMIERTFRLKQKGDSWVWIYDDNGEIAQDKTFSTEAEAQAFMQERTKDSLVVRTPIEQ